MHSCIYSGKVAHFRRGPVKHRFRYSLFMAYLDLDELPGLVRRSRLLSASRFAPASFLRKDHAGESDVPLGESIRQIVKEQTGHRPGGPIRLLTQLRYWGIYFSPINLYYCFEGEEQVPQTIVAEVNNTPWGEQHCYVLWNGNRVDTARGGGKAVQRFQHEKTFHVSPFMSMDADYHWRLTPPSDRLGVCIQSRRGDEPLFDATMNLRRTQLNDRALAAHLLRFPVHSVKIVAAIYFEALRLWLKRVPFYPHPRKLARTQRPISHRPAVTNNR